MAQEKDIHSLYAENKLVFTFLKDSSSRNKSPKANDTLPDGAADQFYSSFYDAIESTYQKGNLKGLRMIRKDLKEASKGLKAPELKELNELLESQGFE
jgi:hypothetical protein